MRDDTSRKTGASLAAAEKNVGVHVARVAKGLDDHAAHLLLAEASDPLLKEGQVRPALHLQGGEPVCREARQERRGAHFLDEGAEPGRGPDGDEAPTTREGGNTDVKGIITEIRGPRSVNDRVDGVHGDVQVSAATSHTCACGQEKGVGAGAEKPRGFVGVNCCEVEVGRWVG